MPTTPPPTHTHTQHPHVALIMELAEGGNLSERIHHPHKRRLELLEALQTCREIAEGLAHLHPLVIHGDLKPQNVLLDRQVGAVSMCPGAAGQAGGGGGGPLPLGLRMDGSVARKLWGQLTLVCVCVYVCVGGVCATGWPMTLSALLAHVPHITVTHGV